MAALGKTIRAKSLRSIARCDMHRRAMNESDQHETHAHPVLACLGVASRFRLVKALAVADRCVGELAELVGLSQSCTTRHLQALERVGLVRGHREGRRVRYRLRAEAPELSELLGWALSGAGLESMAAVGRPGRDQVAARPIPTKADRRTRSNDASRSPGEAGWIPMAAAEPGFSTDPVHPGAEDSQAAAGPSPSRRPDDLEDYLL
jgi:DNA-binding transcriptional ArsR family regulator